MIDLLSLEEQVASSAPRLSRMLFTLMGVPNMSSATSERAEKVKRVLLLVVDLLIGQSSNGQVETPVVDTLSFYRSLSGESHSNSELSSCCCLGRSREIMCKKKLYVGGLYSEWVSSWLAEPKAACPKRPTAACFPCELKDWG